MLQTTESLVSSIFMFESHMKLAVLMLQNTDSRSIITATGIGQTNLEIFVS